MCKKEDLAAALKENQLWKAMIFAEKLGMSSDKVASFAEESGLLPEFKGFLNCSILWEDLVNERFEKFLSRIDITKVKSADLVSMVDSQIDYYLLEEGYIPPKMEVVFKVVKLKKLLEDGEYNKFLPRGEHCGFEDNYLMELLQSKKVEYELEGKPIPEGLKKIYHQLGDRLAESYLAEYEEYDDVFESEEDLTEISQSERKQSTSSDTSVTSTASTISQTPDGDMHSSIAGVIDLSNLYLKAGHAPIPFEDNIEMAGLHNVLSEVSLVC